MHPCSACRFVRPAQGFLSRGFVLSIVAMLAIGILLAYINAGGLTGRSRRQFERGLQDYVCASRYAAYGGLPISLSAADFVSRDYDAHIAELVHATPAPDWLILLSRYSAQMVLALAVVRPDCRV